MRFRRVRHNTALGPHRGNLQLTIAAGRTTGGGYPVEKYEAEMQGMQLGGRM
jgi:hypothetical protein